MSRDTRIVDATFVHADTSPGVAGSTTGVGAPWTDFEGSHWKINANRIYGVSFANDGVKACCYYDSGNILEGAVRLDYDSFNVGCLMRFTAASGGSGYVFAINGAPDSADGPFYIKKCVNGTQTDLASNQDWGGDFIVPANSQIELQIRDIYVNAVIVGVLITVAIRDRTTPTITYGMRQYYDLTAPITATGRAGVATYFNGVYGGGGATRIQTFSQTALAASEDRFGIVFIGDSITAGIGTTGGSCRDSGACSAVCAINIFDQGDAFMAFTNAGIAGTTSTNWANDTGTADLNATIADAVAKGITHASIMIGTNDAQVGFLAAATYKTNVQTIVGRLQAGGIPKVILHQSPYNNNPLHSGGQHATCIALLQSYSTKLDEIADSTVGVYRGDRTLYADSHDDDFATYYPDGIHPIQSRANVIADKWATAWRAIRYGVILDDSTALPGDTISGNILGSGMTEDVQSAYLSLDGTVTGAIALEGTDFDTDSGDWTGTVPATTPPGTYYVVMVTPTLISSSTIEVTAPAPAFVKYGRLTIEEGMIDTVLPESERDSELLIEL